MKKLTCNNFNTDRVFRWRLIIKCYGPDIEYIQCDKIYISRSVIKITPKYEPRYYTEFHL